MPTRLLLVIDDAVPEQRLNEIRSLAGSFAAFTEESIFLARLKDEDLSDLRAWAIDKSDSTNVERIDPPAGVSAAPMSAAEFVWLEDGKPDWSSMWQSFCDLALYGGPPHRGEEEAIGPPAEEAIGVPVDFDAITEIRRGIWETTGLFSEPAEPGWLAVSCSSRKMAAWLAAAIILENVEARFEDERLLVPASPDYELKNQVKSVITVVAKTNHYWSAHVQEQEALARRQEAAQA